jgi:hypothetical protein
MKHLDPFKKITNKPVIKFNGGKPVCLCTQCSVIIERIKYNKDEDKWTTLMGGEVPLLCDSCRNKSFINK